MLLIRVSLRSDDQTDIEPLGRAEEAITDPRLSDGDRAAIRNTATALDYVRGRFGYHGLDDPARGVQLVLHSSNGPAAASGKIYVPAQNPFTGMDGVQALPGVVLPPDAARHELVHLIQAEIIGTSIAPPPEEPGMRADPAVPYQQKSVAEGLADAFATLESQSWQSGAAFFAPRPGTVHVARDYDAPTSPQSLGHPRVAFDLAVARDLTVDPHLQGGVIVMTARAMQHELGWEHTQDIFWALLNDHEFSASRQTWADVAAGLERIADARTATDPAASAAIRDALHATRLDTARS